MTGFKRPSNREQRREFSDGKTDELLAECRAWKDRKRRLAWLANDHVPSGIVGSGRLVGNLSNGISDEIDDTNEREESAWRNGRDCSMTIMVFPRTFGTNGWIRRLLAAGRPTRRSRRVSQSVGRSVGRACAVSYGESYRGWNEPRAVKDGRHPCELRSSCRNFHPTTSSMCTPCTLKNYVARSSLV